MQSVNSNICQQCGMKKFTINTDNKVVSERGRLVPGINGGYVLEIEGKYQFIVDDGKLYITEYRGDRDGFHVDGSHLPKSVLVPSVAISK